LYSQLLRRRRSRRSPSKARPGKTFTRAHLSANKLDVFLAMLVIPAFRKHKWKYHCLKKAQGQKA
jgi:hypothetical protein